MNYKTSSPRLQPRQPTMQEVMHRLARMESRLVQLMKHQGMKDDGRGNALPEDKEGN